MMKVRVKFNNLSKADGSAVVDQDHNIVQATVFGPVDISQSKLNYEEAVVEILYKPKIGIPPTNPAFDQIREIEHILRSIFREVILTRSHPRTSISIAAQEIYDAGSILSTTINAVTCALLDAGIPMKCPVAAVTVSIVEGNLFNLVFDKNLDLITVLSKGDINEKALLEAIDRGKEEAKDLFEIMRENVRQRFTI